MGKERCQWGGGIGCKSDTMHFSPLNTQTYLTPGITLEQIQEIVNEAVYLMPYCPKGVEIENGCDEHKHTPDIIAAVDEALRTKLYDKLRST